MAGAAPAPSWDQAFLTLPARGRGVHLVTDELLRQIPQLTHYTVGLCHLFLQHTSASLCLGEGAAPEVRRDLERWLSHLAPDGWPGFQHVDEGPDDMPAHAKNALLGVSLTLPISRGRLALGTWQGIYLCEHRDAAPARHLVATLCGQGGTSIFR